MLLLEFFDHHVGRRFSFRFDTIDIAIDFLITGGKRANSQFAFLSRSIPLGECTASRFKRANMMKESALASLNRY